MFALLRATLYYRILVVCWVRIAHLGSIIIIYYYIGGDLLIKARHYFTRLAWMKDQEGTLQVPGPIGPRLCSTADTLSVTQIQDFKQTALLLELL